MKRIIKFIAIGILFFILIALIPVNFFNKNFQTNRQILVTLQACTDCTEVRLLKGNLEIPLQFKKTKISQGDLTLIGNSPFKRYDLTKNYNIYVNNTILLEGKVVGLDSLNFDSVVPVFEVYTWKTVDYAPIFWTF